MGASDAEFTDAESVRGRQIRLSSSDFVQVDGDLPQRHLKTLPQVLKPAEGQWQ